MRFALILMLTLLAAVISGQTQEHPAVNAQPNSIYVGADGKYEAAPDTAVLQFGISAQDDTSKAAYERANHSAEQIRQVLRSNGLDPQAAQIGFFSIQPVYDWKQPKHKLIAYRVSASVELKLKDFAKVAPLLQQLADLDVGDSLGLDYSLENMDVAKNRAVTDAYRRARDSAEAVARASSRTLGTLSYASVDTFEPIRMAVPMTGMRMRSEAAGIAAAPTEQFSPKTITVTAHVNAVFGLQ